MNILAEDHPQPRRDAHRIYTRTEDCHRHTKGVLGPAALNRQVLGKEIGAANGTALTVEHRHDGGAQRVVAQEHNEHHRAHVCPAAEKCPNLAAQEANSDAKPRQQRHQLDDDTEQPKQSWQRHHEKELLVVPARPAPHTTPHTQAPRLLTQHEYHWQHQCTYDV